MAIGKAVDSKAVHPISKVFSSVGVTIPEMVVAEAMLDAPLELPNIPATVLTGVHAIPMALTV